MDGAHVVGEKESLFVGGDEFPRRGAFRLGRRDAKDYEIFETKHEDTFQ